MNSIELESWYVNANDPDALTYLLGLSEFRVAGIEYDAMFACLVIISEPVSPQASCPNCGHMSRRVHQYHRRAVRDFSMAGRETYIEFSLRRFKCQPCDGVFTEQLAAIAPYARYTRRYQQYLYKQVRGRSVQSVRRQEKLGYKAVEGQFYQQIEKVVEREKTVVVRRLGIDEIALKKGHKYALIISDLERRQVLEVLPDRKKETLEAYLDTWSLAQRQAVQDVAVDLWKQYHQAVQAKLPNARLNADRFHVMKQLNDQVTKTRRTIQRQVDPQQKDQLKGSRWLLVRNQENLSEKQQAKLDTIYAVSEELKILHQLKEAFRDIFETAPDRDTAELQLIAWMITATATGFAALGKFVSTLAQYWDSILNYFNEHITSGFVEGMNNKIKLVKRIAYGYGNFDHFRWRVLFECNGSP